MKVPIVTDNHHVSDSPAYVVLFPVTLAKLLFSPDLTERAAGLLIPGSHEALRDRSALLSKHATASHLTHKSKATIHSISP